MDDDTSQCPCLDCTGTLPVLAPITFITDDDTSPTFSCPCLDCTGSQPPDTGVDLFTINDDPFTTFSSSPCSCPECTGTQPVWAPKRFAPKQPPDRAVDLFTPKPQYWRYIPGISPRPLLGLAITLKHPNGLLYLWNCVGDPEKDELYAALERSHPITRNRVDDVGVISQDISTGTNRENNSIANSKPYLTEFTFLHFVDMFRHYSRAFCIFLQQLRSYIRHHFLFV